MNNETILHNLVYMSSSVAHIFNKIMYFFSSRLIQRAAYKDRHVSVRSGYVEVSLGNFTRNEPV
jgi:hypothetical protein